MVFKYTIFFFAFLLLNLKCNKSKSSQLKQVFIAKGRSSWYGPGFHGKKTANGEKFNMNALTAAHKQIEFGTFVRVTNIENNKEVVVRINDRGPFSKKLIIDLSNQAAGKIGLIKKGIAEVKLEIFGYDIVNQIAYLKHYKNIFKIKRKNKR